MLVKAVLNNGQFQFLQPIQFVHDKVHVMVDIPDNEILGFGIQQAELNKLSSSALIKQLWANRKQVPSDESDLLDGIEKKYE
jgi:hypothetical protein